MASVSVDVGRENRFLVFFFFFLGSDFFNFHFLGQYFEAYPSRAVLAI